MPLLIHPSSCCDVCLETFTYDEPKPPHALPCGHIFCRECLDNLRPSLCPLCRRLFRPIGGARKLITGEQDIDLKPLLFIERLVLKYDADPENEEVTELNQEIDEWLSEGNTSQALVEARRLVEEREKSWTEARNLRREFHKHVRQKMDETATASAMIESLDAKVQELEGQCSAYAAQVESLEQELRSYRGHNHPPPPPQPPRNYRLDYFPPQNGSTQRTNGYTNGYASESSSRPRTPSRTTDGAIVGAVPTTPTSAGSSYSGRGDYENRGTPVGSSSHSRSGSREHRVRISDGQSTTTPTPPRTRPESAATRITIQQGSESRFLPSGPRMNGEYGGQQATWTPGSRSQSRSVSDPFGPAAETSASAHQPRQSRDEDSRRHHRRQGSYSANAASTPNSATSASGGADSSRRHSGLSSYEILMPPENNATTSAQPGLNSSNWIPESRTMRQPYVTVHHTSNAAVTASEPSVQRSLQRSMSTSHASTSSRASRSAFSSTSSLVPSGTGAEPRAADLGRRPSRRSTVQIDDSMQRTQPGPRYLPSTATMPPPASDDHNGRFAPLPATRPLPDSANSSARSSIMSWGDTRSFRGESPSRLPIPDYARLQRADEIDSVSDLPLSWFPEESTPSNAEPSSASSNSMTFQVADISTATEAMSAMAFYNRQLETDEHLADPTPRSRPESLLEDRPIANASTTPGSRRSWDSSSLYVPHSATVPEQERADAYSNEYEDFDSSSRHETGGSSMTTAANPNTRTPSGASLPSSRASRQHLLPLAEDNSPSPGPWWTGLRRPPQPGDDNALGLSDIATSPIISAPTPITPSRSFLQTYSYEDP